MRNLLPWQGQLMVPSATVFTMQPWWVQTAEKALNSPAWGWVTTTFLSVITVPPPTGTSAAFTSTSPSPDGEAEAGAELGAETGSEAGGGAEVAAAGGALSSPYLLQPASAAVDSSTMRRFMSSPRPF